MTDAMPTINLLPFARRVARARQRAAARWVGAGVLLAVASFGPAGAMALGARSSPDETSHRIARATRSLEELTQAEPALRRRLAELRQTDRVLTAVEDRPDWRPVLHALESVASGARFERIDCRLTTDASPEVRIVVMALVASQTEARQLVLRIEGLGVFDSVVLNSENRASLPGGEFVRCEIAARFKLKDGA